MWIGKKIGELFSVEIQIRYRGASPKARIRRKVASASCNATPTSRLPTLSRILSASGPIAFRTLSRRVSILPLVPLHPQIASGIALFVWQHWLRYCPTVLSTGPSYRQPLPAEDGKDPNLQACIDFFKQLFDADVLCVRCLPDNSYEVRCRQRIVRSYFCRSDDAIPQ